MNGLKYLAMKISELEFVIADLIDKRDAEKARADAAEAKLKAMGTPKAAKGV